MRSSNHQLGALALAATLIGALAASSSEAQSAPPPRVVATVAVDELTSSPLQLVRGLTLAAQPEAVFDLVSNSANWPGFASSIEAVAASGRGERGSTWTYTLAAGGTFSSRIVAFDRPKADGVGAFAYAIGDGNPFGVSGHLAILALRPADGGGTVLDYHQIFDHPDPKAIGPAVAAGTEEILGRVLYRFGGERRGGSHGTDNIVIEQRRIARASAQRAWQVLGEQWGEVDAWASAVSHSALQGKRGKTLKGAIRSCEVPGTPGFRETMLAYDEEALSLTYQVIEGVPPFVTRATNTWTLEPLGGDRVVIVSRVDLAVAPGTPAPAAAMAKGQFTQLLDLSADELVHFVETGRPHPRKVAAQGMTMGK